MAINIKTLTIDSHITIGGERVRLRGLDEDNGLIVRFPAEYVKASDVELIPITPALLGELGFERVAKSFYEEHFLGGFKLEWWGQSEYWECCEATVRVRYLHELESLYYLIYEEKLIKD